MNSRITLAALAVATIALSAPAEAHNRTNFVDAAAIPAYPTSNWIRTAKGRHHAAHRARHHRVAAHRRHHEAREASKAHRPRSYGKSGLETVQTAAGIPITVAASFASKIQGFISDLKARGYQPRQIHCFASGGHVRHSLHYSGHACDFDQTGWGKTASAMYHVADLVRKWNLRDGGEFLDWGHIDDGPHLSRSRRVAAIKATPFYGATSLYHDRHRHHHRVRYAHR
jgi:hypothetical protein